MRAGFAAALLLALPGPAALACGYCVEDKPAATYDHRVVTRAMERGRAMVSFSFDSDRHSIASAIDEINRGLSSRKIALTVLRVVDSRRALPTK